MDVTDHVASLLYYTVFTKLLWIFELLIDYKVEDMFILII